MVDSYFSKLTSPTCWNECDKPHSMSALLIVLSADGHIVQFNRASERITGLSHEHVQGQEICNVISDIEGNQTHLRTIPILQHILSTIQTRQRAYKKQTRLQKNKSAVPSLTHSNIPPLSSETLKVTQKIPPPDLYFDDFECEWFGKSGRIYLIHWSVNIILKPNNHTVEYILLTGTDQSERRRVEMILAQERKLFMSGPVIVLKYGTSEKWPVHYISQNVTQFGYLAEEFLTGKLSYTDIIHQNDRQRVMAEVNVYVEAGSVSFEQEYRILSASREVRWVFDFTVIVRDTQGNVLCFDGYVLDITSRKQIEEDLCRSEARYRAIVEEQMELVCRFSPDTTLTFANEAYCRYFGVNHEGVIGKSFLAFIPEEAHEKVLSDIQLALNQGQTITREYPAKAHNHKVTWQQWTSRIISNRDGLVEEIQAVGRDITQQKQMEQALRTSESRLAEAQRIAHLGNWEWNVRTGEERWSEEIYRILGVSPGQMQITHEIFERAIHEDDYEAVMEALGESILHDKPYQIDFRILRQDGNIRYVQAFGKLVRSSNGNPVRLIGTAQDITERKNIENALQQSQSRLDEAQRIAQLGTWEWNIQTGEEQWSEEMYRILGIVPERLRITHEVFENVIHPDDYNIVMQAFERAIFGNKPYRIEFRIYRSNGSLRYVQAFGSLIRSNSGGPSRLIGTAQDITEHKQAEIALEQANETLKQFKMTLDMTVDSVYMFDSETLHFFYVNQGAINHLGYKQEEYLKMSVYNINPEFSLPEGFTTLVVSGNTPHARTYETLYRHKNGTLIPVEVALQYIRLPPSENGENRSHFVTIVRDITAHKQAQIRLKEAKEAAEIANRAKSAFLANMSHELRTPLNGILGYTQILMRDKTLSPQQRDEIAVIHRNGEYLLTLINDILDLSKIEAERIELYPTDFRLNEFLKGINELFSMRAKQKGITYVYESLSYLPLMIRVDEKRLRQILINLLSNAIKFTDKGTVKLKVGYHHEKIRFQIEDTGVGISPEDAARIFQPFQQVGERNYRAQGSGLGLAITKKLVEMMGGEIHFESRLGEGSLFWVALDLPEVFGLIKPDHLQEPIIVGYQVINNEILEREGRQYFKVLIVDDKTENRSVLVNLLQPLGFEIAEAYDGQECIEKAKLWKPDIILMDLVMPIMDGFATTAAIRKIETIKDTVIIAISASAFDYHQQRSIEAGCNEFIAKPLYVEVLLSYLQKHLRLAWVYEQTSSGNTLLQQEEDFGLNLNELPVKPSIVEATMLFNLAMMGDINGILEYAEGLAKNEPQLMLFTRNIERLATEFETHKICEIAKRYMETNL